MTDFQKRRFAFRKLPLSLECLRGIYVLPRGGGRSKEKEGKEGWPVGRETRFRAKERRVSTRETREKHEGSAVDVP